MTEKKSLFLVLLEVAFFFLFIFILFKKILIINFVTWQVGLSGEEFFYFLAIVSLIAVVLVNYMVSRRKESYDIFKEFPLDLKLLSKDLLSSLEFFMVAFVRQLRYWNVSLQFFISKKSHSKIQKQKLKKKKEIEKELFLAKIRGARFALMLLEFVMAIVVAVVVYVLLTDKVQFLKEGLPTEAKYFVAIIILAVVFYAYNFSRPYRQFVEKEKQAIIAGPKTRSKKTRKNKKKLLKSSRKPMKRKRKK